MKENPDSPEELQTKIELLTKRRGKEFGSGKDIREVNILLDPSLRYEFTNKTSKPFELISLQYVYGIIDLQLAMWRARLEVALKKAKAA